MLIKKVQIKNFGIIKNESISFGPGIHVFRGKNWNGKSTILKSIYLNLFDYYIGKYEDYVNWDADSFVSIVHFSHEGLEYSSEILYDKNGATRALSVDGEVFHNSDAKIKLQEVIPKELMMAAMVSEQNRVDLISTKPAERREYLRKIFEVNFEKEVLEIGSIYDQLLVQSTEYEKQRYSIANKEYNFKETPIAPFSIDILESKKSKVEKLKTKKILFDEQLSRYKEQRFRIFELTAELERALEKIENGQNQIEKSQLTLEVFGKRIIKEKQELEEDLKDLTKNLLIISKEEKDFKPIEEKINSLIISRIPIFDSTLLESTKENSLKCEFKISNLKKDLEQFNKGICPTCGSDISDPVKAQEALDSMEELEKELKDFQKIIEEELQKKKVLQEKENVNEEVRQEKAKLQESLITKKSDFELGKSKISLLIDNKKELITGFDDKVKREKTLLEESLKDKESEKLEIEKLKKELLVKLSTAKSDLIEEPEDSFQFDGEIDSLENSIKIFHDWEIVLSECAKHNQELEKEEEEDKKLSKTISDSINDLEIEIEEYKKAIKILKTDFPTYILTAKTKALSGKMNNFLEQTQGAEHGIDLVLGSRNSLRVVYGPKKSDVGLASGYEQQVFSVAWKSALSETIGNKTLILDEADSNGDSENSSKFFEYVFGLVGSQYEQIFVISHKEEVLSRLQGSFTFNEYIIEKGKII